MLKTKIKASQITNLTDARYFAAWGVDWVGFDLQMGNSSYIPPSSLLGIKDWITGPKIIGEYELGIADEIKATIAELELNGVQVGPFFDINELAKFENIEIIQKIVVDDASTGDQLKGFLAERSELVNLFLLDFTANDIKWSELSTDQANVSMADIQQLATDYPILLDIAFEVANYPKLLATGIKGFGVKGGAEEKVGYKSFDDLDELFEVLEVEE